MEKKRSLLYLVFVFAFSVLIGVALYLNQRSGLLKPDNALVIAGIVFMFCPLISSILTMAITREGFSAFSRAKPKFMQNRKWYLLACFLPGALIVFGAIVYFLIFPQNFDLSAPMMAKAGATLPITLTPPLLVLIALALIVGAPFVIVNHVAAFGEEFGWRGYLLPKLMGTMSAPKAIVCNGALWGLAHFPLTIFGHNYGLGSPLHPFLPILMMMLFATAMGTFLSYLTLKTDSVIPASIAHGATNAVGGAAIFFVASGYVPLLGPNVAGLFGMSGFLILAVYLLAKLKQSDVPEN